MLNIYKNFFDSRNRIKLHVLDYFQNIYLLQFKLYLLRIGSQYIREKLQNLKLILYIFIAVFKMFSDRINHFNSF
jgi:hypothetical protein